jgi:hypothetical protein
LPEFRYKVVASAAEESYFDHTNKNIYDVLGKDLDLTKITLIVEADNEEESERIRIAVTDIRMWEQIKFKGFYTPL